MFKTNIIERNEKFEKAYKHFQNLLLESIDKISSSNLSDDEKEKLLEYLFSKACDAIYTCDVHILNITRPVEKRLKVSIAKFK